MKTAILCVCILALLCTAAYAQNPFDSVTKGVKDATSKVTGAVDKTVNGTKNAANSVANGTKSAVDGVKGAADAVGNIGKKSAAGYTAPAISVFAAAGFGSLLLLAL